MSDLPDDSEFIEPPAGDTAPPDYRVSPSLAHHEDLTAARLSGYDWDQINGYQARQRAVAYQAGYSQQDIDSHLGYIEPPAADYDRHWQQQFAVDPELVTGLSTVPRSALTPLDGLSATRIAGYAGVSAPPADAAEPTDGPAPFSLLTDTTRGAYVDALLNGATRSPQDFAERYAGAFLGTAADLTGSGDQAATVAHAARDLAANLPSNEDLTDVAIGLAQAGGAPLAPGAIAVIKKNLADAWADTGQPLMGLFRAANTDPAVLDALTTPKTIAPVWDIGAALGRVAQAAAAGVEDVYAAPLAAGRDEWGINEPGVSSAKILAYIAAKDVDALARVPPAVFMGLARAGNQILQEAGVSEADANRTMRDAIGIATALGGPEMVAAPRVRVVDPLAKPAEAIREVPATEAFPENPPVNRVARDFASRLDEDLQAKMDRAEQLRLENTGVVPGNATESGSFFQRKLAEMGEEAKGPEPTPQEIVDLAKGYQTADGVGATFRALLEDNSGSGPNPFTTAAQDAARAERRQGRDAAKAIIREFRGLADRRVAQIYANLEDYRRDINKHLPEFEAEVKKGPMGNPDNTMIGNLFNYMEGRSLGATLKHDSPFTQVADEIRDQNQKMANRINASGQGRAFIEDYFVHMWKDPRKAADEFLGVGRQGTGASLRERTIPTISEGLARGLEPRIYDPIEAQIQYSAGMLSHLAALDIIDAGHSAGYIKYFPLGRPDPGYVPLVGKASIKPAGNAGFVLQAHAPPGFAAPYNRWLGKGFYANPVGGAIYDKVRFLANAMTAAKLAFSGYHFVTIGTESMMAGLTEGFGAIGRGQLVEGLKQLGLASTIIGKPIESAIKGARIEKQFLGVKDYGPEMERLADIAASSGMRMTSRQQIYRVGSTPTIFQSMSRPSLSPAKWRDAVAKGEGVPMVGRGTLFREIAKDATDIFGKSDEAPAFRAAMIPARAAGFFVHEIGRAMDTLMVPLFDKFIPWVKNAAWADEMESWLKAHPTAGRDDVLRQGRNLSDSMDDRFGEMNQDNLFWNQTLKQSLNLVTVSVGWEYGTIRAVGGALADIAKGDLSSTRARWMVAFPLGMALSSAVYQYLKTGQGPGGPLDLMVPQTGGTTPKSGEEHAILPGYQKDYFQWYKALRFSPDFIGAMQNLTGIARNKLNPMMQAMLTTFVTGTDAIGHNIRNLPNPHFGVGGWELPPGYANYLKFWGEELLPIPFQQPHIRGSALTDIDRFMGIRQAPRYMTDPEGYQAALDKLEKMRTGIELGRAKRENSQLETPDPDIGVPQPRGGHRGGGGGSRPSRSRHIPGGYPSGGWENR